MREKYQERNVCLPIGGMINEKLCSLPKNTHCTCCANSEDHGRQRDQSGKKKHTEYREKEVTDNPILTIFHR